MEKIENEIREALKKQDYDKVLTQMYYLYKLLFITLLNDKKIPYFDCYIMPDYAYKVVRSI